MWAAEALQRRHVGEDRHAVVVASPAVGLDIYAGPVTRYVAGDWLTIVQQAGAASGIPVEVIRPNEPADAIHDTSVVEVAVGEWQGRLLQSLDVVGDWADTADAPYSTDKPDWDGYGAVVLLAAGRERPDLAPGTRVGKGLRRSRVPTVMPRQFQDSEAFKAASKRADHVSNAARRSRVVPPDHFGPDRVSGADAERNAVDDGTSGQTC